ncbi:MAG: helix-turn-helix domain-containing protein [Bradymonadia bacterium]
MAEVITLGTRLKGILKERGRSQTWLAEKTGIDRSEINRILNGRKAPRGEHLRWMATALGMDVDQLVGDAQIPQETVREAERLQSVMEKKLLAESERDIALARVKSLEAQLEAETQRRISAEAELETIKSEQAETTEINRSLRNSIDGMKEARQKLAGYAELLKQQRDNAQAALDEARSWIQRLSAEHSAQESWNTFLGRFDRFFNTSFSQSGNEDAEPTEDEQLNGAAAQG